MLSDTDLGFLKDHSDQNYVVRCCVQKWKESLESLRPKIIGTWTWILAVGRNICSIYFGVGTIGMDKVICLLEAKLGNHIRLLTFIQILRVEKLPQSKVWKQTIVSLLQYTTEGSDCDTSRRKKEIKFQKKLMQCLRGRDLRNDYVEEEKCKLGKFEC